MIRLVCGTLFVPPKLTETNSEEHEGSDDDGDLSDDSEHSSDLSYIEDIKLPPSVCDSGKLLDITFAFDGTILCPISWDTGRVMPKSML